MIRTRYKKRIKADKVALVTATTLLTAGLIAVIAMIAYYAIKDGWQSVLDWFSSRWACLVGVIVLIAGVAALYLLSFFRKWKELKDEA